LQKALLQNPWVSENQRLMSTNVAIFVTLVLVQGFSDDDGRYPTHHEQTLLPCLLHLRFMVG
jgi:hypothetical protein